MFYFIVVTKILNIKVYVRVTNRNVKTFINYIFFDGLKRAAI